MNEELVERERVCLCVAFEKRSEEVGTQRGESNEEGVGLDLPRKRAGFGLWGEEFIFAGGWGLL